MARFIIIVDMVAVRSFVISNVFVSAATKGDVSIMKLKKYMPRSFFLKLVLLMYSYKKFVGP